MTDDQVLECEDEWRTGGTCQRTRSLYGLLEKFHFLVLNISVYGPILVTGEIEYIFCFFSFFHFDF